MHENPDFAQVLDQIRDIVAEASDEPKETTLAAVCDLLSRQVGHYNWVGFYLVDPAASRELVLGPFNGAPTEHTHIAFGQGICGQAADTEQTFIIQDVSLETNYLSCSPDVHAEIVIPIFKDGAIVGELDIDSHHLAPFTDSDRSFLEAVCDLLSALF